MFTYWGEELVGFDHAYNTTALNERAVELPIVAAWYAKHGAGVGLEVGNVMHHYWPALRHRVVDLYEQADGVENIDVMATFGRYDWIVAISTIEHVRWDTSPRRPNGARAALNHLASLLTHTGRMLVTIPTGHHPELDRSLAEDDGGATRACTLVRVAAGGWVQTATPQFLPYGTTTAWAESVWIGEW